MDEKQYFSATRKKPIKTKPRTRPLPKATQKKKKKEKRINHSQDKLSIKYVKKFQFKTTKHWRFDFLLVE